ncbi:MAG TPA: sigma-70 family RNA polymerase sigma factor [Candidatus Binataceae bacterium]|nr:sigma-70 family RNA polymerase sigma factor [Candidatus Binataceae bacterium]
MLAALSLKRAWSEAVRPDDELIAEVRNGQTAAFAELVSRYRDRVERLCQRFFSDREVVRDLAQESFIRAFAGLSTYRAEMPFLGWLRAIVANVCYDELRRRRRKPEELIADFTGPEANWLQLVDHATPEQLVEAAEERREAHELAHRLLNSLRPEDRMVMVLRESEGLSVDEVAAMMGWSEAKVKIRAFRARQFMRKQAEAILSERRRRVAK